MSRAFYNVVILGVAFLLLFTAFQTCGMIQASVLDDAGLKGAGYTSLAIIYAVFALANWIAPSVVALLGPKWSMLISGLCYTGFVLSFLQPNAIALYCLSAVLGVAAAVLWTAQGNFLTLNSTEQTMGRNSGLFWAMLQSSLVFGNLYFFFQTKGEADISDGERRTIYTVLGVVSSVGCLMLVLLVKPPEDMYAPLSVQNENDDYSGASLFRRAFSALVRSFKLLLTKEMLLISVTNFYTGLELTFFSGVYGTAIGHTKIFGEDSESYIGISGMFIGAGEIVGGLLFGILGKKTIKYGRDPVVLLGYIVHMVCFFLCFMNLPPTSPIGDTHGGSYLEPMLELAFACSFLLGFGDACFNTQIYSLLGSYFKHDSASAFALFKFIQSTAAAVAFFYSNDLHLQYQLLILVVFGTVGAISFFFVEHHPPREEI